MDEDIDYVKKMQFWTCILDWFRTLFVLVFIIWYKIKSGKKLAKIKAENCTTSKYAVLFDNIPKESTQEDVREVLKSTEETASFNIHEINFMRDFKGFVDLYKKRAEIEEKIEKL